MAYVALSDLDGKIPPPFIVQALDDDADGVVDAGLWDLIASQAGQAVDARLGQRYEVPFTEPPAVVKEAALVFAAEALYARRVGPDANPWMAMGNAMRSKLDRIGRGEEPLAPTINRQKPSGVIVAEPSRTAGSRLAF